MAFRVINWATGHTGKMVVRAVAERPEDEIAGAFVYNPEKIGRDLGELCGIDQIGAKTTGDRQPIRETAADCVLGRKSVGEGKGVAVSGGIGGRSFSKKK